MEATPATVAAALPWIEQLKLSLEPNELGGVAKGLAEATPSLAKLSGEQVPVFKQTEAFNKCLTKVIYPVGNTKLQDGNATTGVENYKEFWYSLVGLSGIGQSFDGNGAFTKFLVGNSGADAEVRAGDADRQKPERPQRCSLARRCRRRARARRSRPPSRPYQPLAPCCKQTLPEFNGPLSNGPADGIEDEPSRAQRHEGGLTVREQIERYRTAFIAVVTMVVIAAAVGGYILAHENLHLPSWVPVLGHDYYDLKAEFQTAQAVTPGQGQAVTIAGAKVGEVGERRSAQRHRRGEHESDAQVRALLQGTRRCCCVPRRSCRTSRSRSTRARPRPGS